MIIAAIDLSDTLSSIFFTLLWVALGAIVLGIILLALVVRRLKQIDLPEDASVIETLQAVPFGLVLAIDLLDLGMDVFAAPVVWIILGRFGLQKLRQVSVLEALVPGTQLIPMMTISWFIARLGGRFLADEREAEDGKVIDHEPAAR